MNARLNRTLAPTVIVAALIGSLESARSEEQGPLTRAEAGPRVGDVLRIASESASLMLGQQVLGALPKGRPIVITEVRKAWIGTHLPVNGRQVAGWIHLADFVPREDLGGTVANPSPYWDDWLTGRHLRHETDPNIHVWEPWRR